MIQLTRPRHGEPFFVNPDLLERVDTHVDTVVRLTTGTELRVAESGDEIVRRIADFRARVMALAGLLQDAAHGSGPDANWADPNPSHDGGAARSALELTVSGSHQVHEAADASAGTDDAGRDDDARRDGDDDWRPK